MSESKDQPNLEKIYESILKEGSFYGASASGQGSVRNHSPAESDRGLSFSKGQVPTTSPGHTSPVNTMNSNEEDDVANSYGSDILLQLEDFVEKWENENTNPDIELSVAINDIKYLLKHYKELHMDI